LIDSAENLRFSKKLEQLHNKMSKINPETEFDLDCEFGMEHIEKFRANKVRDEFPGEFKGELDPEKPPEIADAAEKEVGPEEGKSFK